MFIQRVAGRLASVVTGRGRREAIYGRLQQLPEGWDGDPATPSPPSTDRIAVGSMTIEDAEVPNDGAPQPEQTPGP